MTRWTWNQLCPRCKAALAAELGRWRGRRRMPMPPCLQLVGGVLNNLYGTQHPIPSIPERPPGHVVQAAIAEMLRLFPCDRVDDRTIEPGDLMLSCTKNPQMKNRRVGHVSIAATEPWRFVFAAGHEVREESLSSLGSVITVYRPRNKAAWIREAD